MNTPIKLTQGAANLLRYAQKYPRPYLETDHPEADKRARQFMELYRKGLAYAPWEFSGRVVLTSAGEEWGKS